VSEINENTHSSVLAEEERDIYLGVINRFIGYYSREAQKETKNDTAKEYPFVAMDTRQVFEQIRIVHNHLGMNNGPDKTRTFLDVGCGIGNIMLIAEQFSFENLQLAMGGGTITPDAGPPAIQTYTPPASDEFNYYAVLFRTKAPGTDKVRDIQIPRLISVSSLDVAHTKGANPSALAIDVRALKESGVDVFTAVELT